MNERNDNKDLPKNTKDLLIKSFFAPFLNQIGQSLGLVMGGLIISGIILVLLQYFVVPVISDTVGAGATTVAIAAGAGATTAALSGYYGLDFCLAL